MGDDNNDGQRRAELMDQAKLPDGLSNPVMTFVRGVYDAERVVKSGTWLYAGETTCDVRIVYSPICFGSGDDDDPPELMYDVKRDTFYVEYGSTIERGVFNAGGGGFTSVGEAMRHAEAALQGVKWIP